jgi:hypothetical protein
MKIPSDLFENKQLKLSPLLIKSYIDKLNVLGKFEESKINMKGSIGGNEEDEAIRIQLENTLIDLEKRVPDEWKKSWGFGWLKKK